MKTVVVALAVILLAGVVSCGPTLKVSSDYDRSVDFTKYKTFSLYNLRVTGSVSQLNADRIMTAVKNEMQAKGYTLTDSSSADLIVNAVTILQNKQDVTATTNYYGYGGMYRPYGYWGTGMGYGSTTTSVYEYKNGTLTIDVVDNRARKAIWQGVGNADIDHAPKDPDTAIKDGVHKIMESFPAAR